MADGVATQLSRRLEGFVIRHELAIAIIAIGICVAETIFFSQRLHVGIVPDEAHHIDLSLSWMKSLPHWIADTSETHHLGQVSRQPPLYHALMGFVGLALPQEQVQNGLRLFNAILGTLFFALVVAAVRDLYRCSFIRVGTVVVITNIITLPLLFAGVTYDNLTNVISLLAFWCLARYFRDHTLNSCALTILIVCLGCLTKVTFLPLALIVTVLAGVGLVMFRKETAQFFSKTPELRELLIIIGIFVFGSLNLYFYGYNLTLYGEIVPACESVLSRTNCQNWGIWAWEQQALATKSEVAPFFHNFIKSYIQTIHEHLVGIFTFPALKAPWIGKFMRELAYLSMIAGGIMAIRKRIMRKSQFHFGSPLSLCLIVTVFYALVVAINNYWMTNRYGVIGYALQGRYLFPIVFPATIIAVSALFRGFKKSTHPWLFSWLLLTMLASGQIILLSRVPAEWLRTAEIQRDAGDR